MLLRDRCPASISWEHYEANLARLEANRARAASMGAVRNGAARLAGLVVWAQWGARLPVYSHPSDGHPAPFPSDGHPAPFPYGGTRRRDRYGGPLLCQHVAGPCLDACVGEQVLAGLAPAALELSLAAAQQVEQERAALTPLCSPRSAHPALLTPLCSPRSAHPALAAAP